MTLLTRCDAAGCTAEAVISSPSGLTATPAGWVGTDLDSDASVDFCPLHVSEAAHLSDNLAREAAEAEKSRPVLVASVTTGGLPGLGKRG